MTRDTRLYLCHSVHGPPSGGALQEDRTTGCCHEEGQDHKPDSGSPFQTRWQFHRFTQSLPTAYVMK